MTEQQVKNKKSKKLSIIYTFAEFPEPWGITLVVYKNGENYRHYLCDTKKEVNRIKTEYKRMF